MVSSSRDRGDRRRPRPQPKRKMTRATLAPGAGSDPNLNYAVLLDEARRRVEQLTLLNRIAALTSQAEDIVTATQQALELVLGALLGVDVAATWLIDEHDSTLKRFATAGRLTGDSSGQPLVIDGGLPSSAPVTPAAATSEVAIFQLQSGEAAPPEIQPFLPQQPVATLICFPLRRGRHVIGLLVLYAFEPRALAPSEVTFLETLADQLGAQLDVALAHLRHDEQQQRLETIIEQLPEAISIANSRGQIIRFNHVAEELWGHPPQPASLEQVPEVYGLHTPEGRLLAWQETPMVRALQRDEQSVGYELLIRRPDGSEAPILSNCTSLHDSNGKLLGSAEVFQDISRLKELDHLKDDFINTVSHELRTPTTTIRGGALTLLRRGDRLDETTKRQLLNDMAEEAERLHILVEDLLSLTRIQAGMRLTTEPVIPARFVNRMILELGGRISGHTLTVNVPENLPIIEADLFCLEHIFRDLLENAVKFSPHGERIEIEAEPDEDSVVFSIKDRGSGIPAKDLDHLFEPFYRSKDVINSGAQGAGLGLTVCKRLVEMQGGRIWAASRPNGGAVICFTVPSVVEPPSEAVGSSE